MSRASTLDRLDSGPFTKLARTMSRNGDVVVELTGTSCDTDGNTIRIPANSDEIRGADARILHGMLDHEVAHVRQETDIKAARKAGRAGIKTPLEIIKDSKTAAERLMFNAYEDIRIERLASEEYPGVAENLRALAEHTVALYLKEPPHGHDVWQTVGCGIIMRSQMQDVSWMPPALVPLLALLEDEIEESRRARTAEEAHALALRTVDKLKNLEKLAEEEEKRRNERKKKAAKPGGNEKGAGGKNDGDGDGEGGENPTGMEALTDAELEALKAAMAGTAGTDAKADDLTKRTKTAMQQTAVDDAVTHQRYIACPEAKRDDAVIRPDGGTLEGYLACKNRVASQIGALKAKLCSIIRVRAQSRLQGDQERGVLDVAALHTLSMGNRKVFAQRTREENLDTAVSILVDVSGSMGPGQWEGTRSYYAKHMVIALAETFSALNVPYEALGFTNDDGGKEYASVNGALIYGRNIPFQFHLYKGFNESLNQTRHYFDKISGYEQNSDGEAVLFAARRLGARKEARKLLFVVSDGLPTAGHQPLACKYLRETIKRVTAAGVEVYGIGAGFDGVKAFYNSDVGASHIVISKLDSMAVEVFKLVKDRLTSFKARSAA